MNTCGHGRTHGDCEICNLKEELRKVSRQLAASEDARKNAEERLVEYDRWLTNGVYFTNDEYVEECAKNIELKQRAEAAEHRIKASQEQEPVAWEVTRTLDLIPIPRLVSVEPLYVVPATKVIPLYKQPIIPPSLEELQRENVELRRQLELLHISEIQGEQK